jgi:hypothetical protein
MFLVETSSAHPEQTRIDGGCDRCLLRGMAVAGTMAALWQSAGTTSQRVVAAEQRIARHSRQAAAMTLDADHARRSARDALVALAHESDARADAQRRNEDQRSLRHRKRERAPRRGPGASW